MSDTITPSDINDPYGELNISNIPRVQKYLVRDDIIRPKLKTKTVKVSSQVKRTTITRGNFFERKQRFHFLWYSDYEKYSTGFLDLVENFVQFWTQFFTNETLHGNALEVNKIVQLFEYLNIFEVPKLMYYIESKFSSNICLYIRFRAMVYLLNHTVDPIIRSQVKYAYLKDLCNVSGSFITPLDNLDTTFVSVIENPNKAHEVLDMYIYSPWMYLFYIYRFARYSGRFTPTEASK